MRSRSGKVRVAMSEPFVPRQQPQQYPSTNLPRTRSQRDIQFPKVDPQTKGVSSSSSSSSSSKERLSIINRHDQLGTRSTTPTLHFLKTCGVCGRSLGTGYDIYIYRGEIAFCSNECRELHMKHEINNGAYYLHH